MRRVSPKRAAQERQYRRLRAAFLEEHPVCQRCGVHRSSEVHHARGRVGADLLRVEDFRALCHGCHRWLTEHPAHALATGWSLSRVGRAS